MFFVSVADKGVSAAVSGLESTVAGCRVSVDSSRLRRAKVQRSKRVCRLLGGGSCGRSGARRCFCLGWVAEWTGRCAGGCWTERGVELERRGLALLVGGAGGREKPPPGRGELQGGQGV